MKTQETSSTSKEEVPKIKTGLLDKYKKEPKKEVNEKMSAYDRINNRFKK